MAKNTIADLSVTPTNNTDLLGQNSTGSADSNTLDTIIQNALGIMARAYGDQGGLGTVGGSANAITLTSLSTYQQYQDGLQVAFKASAANTGAATLNLDGLGAKKIRRKGDTALAAGDIAANGRYLLQYDAAYDTAAGAWVLLNQEYTPLDADLTALADTGVSAFSGLLYGLTLSNNVSDTTNDIDIAAGIAIDATNAKFMKLASGLTKRLDAAWAVGTNQGGLDTGAIANTTYHMWLIMRSDTGVVDVLFSASATSPTMPASYDYKRRIGSIVRSGGAIAAFVQTGDTFIWNNAAPTADYDSSGNRAKANLTLNVPSGIRVAAILNPSLTSDATDATMTFYDGANTSAGFMIACTVESSLLGRTDQMVQQFTNTSAQIQLAIAGFPFAARIRTSGWIDTRGRNG
jgi:hypothetical protein